MFRIVATIVLAACGVAAAQPYESERDIRLRPFGIASRAEALGLLVGRVRVEQRWNELLDEILYDVAPRGAWDPGHPAWKPARAVAAAVLRRESAVHYEKETNRSIKNVVADYYLDVLDEDGRREATAYFQSPGGQVWLESRQRFLEEHTYGLPFKDDTEPRAAYQRRAAAAKKALLHLPDQQTGAVYDFNQSEMGKKLLQCQNGLVADAAGNVMRSDLDTVALEHRATVAREVRAKVRGVPPPSEKTHLGTVTMRDDRALDVSVEQIRLFRREGTYDLHYAPDSLHWNDVAAGVPGMKPGETRHLYRDARGRLSDRP